LTFTLTNPQTVYTASPSPSTFTFTFTVSSSPNQPQVSGTFVWTVSATTLPISPMPLLDTLKQSCKKPCLERGKYFVCHQKDFENVIKPWAHQEVIQGKRVWKVDGKEVKTYETQEEFNWYKILF